MANSCASAPFDQGLSLADFDMAGISIEGSTPKVHQAMRGKKADLDEVIDAARLVAKEPGVRLKLATVVSAMNRDDLPALAMTVRELGPDVWRLYQYSGRGDQQLRPAATLASRRRVPAAGRTGGRTSRAGTDGTFYRS